MVNLNSAVRQKKAQQIKNVYELLGQHSQIIAVTLDNVSSLQCQQIRRDLNKLGAILVIGKNTVIRKAIELRMKPLDQNDEQVAFLRDAQGGNNAIPELDALKGLLKEKVGFIFTDKPISEVKEIVESNKVQAPAKVGIISPKDIIIPPGPTGMDPSQITFFHALQISTKIQKSQIEITKEYQVCTAGKKIGNSEVSLLQKMNMKPFSYQMNVFACYDNGTILSKDVISLDQNDIIAKFQAGIKNIAAISLETGYQTDASVPYAVVNAFKNLAAIGMEVNYKFKILEELTTAGPAVVQQAAGGSAQPQKEAEPEPEPEEDMDMGGLFD
ncbi:hypothetical protein PPERSA_08694 [Pseudocohnilembus persalinus]|uniref:Large ribosomal subunit protein uL10-like insertion domain-containing protein n=1 Tax=Pseudocohnilembus persalinus TaxID=266149 RepID=A0A0V0R885_PSEPJ|nr:hypothetical protein PPERSA_08694 [Pseudocohnilembus persalinus]|eukprot:KRX10699.1 hypothetical protein PPERSA_08694 [Pseudocohnilembus persalinus]